MNPSDTARIPGLAAAKAGIPAASWDRTSLDAPAGIRPAITTRPSISYRIQFTSDVVKPRTLPPFAYVVTRVNFDSIVYTAVLQSSDLDMALLSIRSYWPNAQPHEAEEGINYFHDADTNLVSKQFGAITAKPPARWWEIHRFGRR